MSMVRRSGCGTFLLALTFSIAASSDAPARQKAKKLEQRPAVALGINIPATQPARYFTINQVLAKRDARYAASGNLQFASTTTTMTDVPVARLHVLPSNEPFGMTTFRAPEGLLWVKWRGIEHRTAVEAMEIALCKHHPDACSRPARHFLSLAESAGSRSGRARIEVVNRSVNAAIKYTSDYVQHGVADFWSAPLETLAAGRGDCEDYAIAKYAILRAAGVPADDMRLLLVRDRAVAQDHAVLAVRNGGDWFILDNRHSLLVETASVPHFTPLFALDHNGVSLFAAPYAARPAPVLEPATVLSPANESSPLEHASTRSEPQASWVGAATPYML